MSEEIRAGDRLEVSRDITVGGRQAFEEGQAVTVDKIDPNPDRPQYRYVVKSPALGKRLQLRAEDLRRPVAEVTPSTGRPAAAVGGAEKKREVPAGAAAGAPPARAPRASRRRMLLLVLLAVLLAAAVIAVVLVVLLQESGADEVLTVKTRELRTVVRAAGQSSTSLSSEIGDAAAHATTPEDFAPVGESIAEKYVPSFQEYSSRISEIRREVAEVKPSPEIEYSRSRLLASCDAYGKAMAGYVTALEQVAKGQVAEATRTLLDVKKLVDNGNSLVGGS